MCLYCKLVQHSPEKYIKTSSVALMIFDINYKHCTVVSVTSHSNLHRLISQIFKTLVRIWTTCDHDEAGRKLLVLFIPLHNDSHSG